MIAYIGLGSNEGDRVQMISQAVAQLHRTPGVHVTQLSLLREYDAVGGPPQDPFVNAVVAVDTTLSPHALLATLQQLERALGRRPSPVRWGPRVIDLDVLLYGDAVIHDEHLTVPHPRLHERQFVLEPLAQLAPAVMHPVLRQSIRDLLHSLCASSDPSVV